MLPVRDVRLDDRTVVRKDRVERLGRRGGRVGKLRPRGSGRDLGEDVFVCDPGDAEEECVLPYENQAVVDLGIRSSASGFYHWNKNAIRLRAVR